MNHVIRITKVMVLEFCKILCYIEPDCVSINIDKREYGHGVYKCELNDVTQEGYEPRLFRNSDLLKEIIMTKEFMGNCNHNGDDGDDDCDINSEGDVKSVYNFFCQNNCVQNPCKSNATCQSGFTEKG